MSAVPKTGDDRGLAESEPSGNKPAFRLHVASGDSRRNLFIALMISEWECLNRSRLISPPNLAKKFILTNRDLGNGGFGFYA